MPASPLKWGSYSKPDVAQVYGCSYGAVKRKPSECDQAYTNGCIGSTTEMAPKRVCLWPPHNGHMDQQASLVTHSRDMMVEDTHHPVHQAHQLGNHMGVSAMPQSQHTAVQSLQQPDMAAFQQQPSLTAESQQVAMSSESQQQLTMDIMDLQSGMVMNINDDDGEVDDYANACDAMDGEGAVDFSQYGGKVASQHENHCFGSERSPNSGQTRCYCRPTWDNMADTVSFFSDIY